jgi:uncharacterized protein YutE (UPF0331/DUF86 family)
MDYIAMYLRDNNIPPRDDYSNTDKTDIFSPAQKQLLREMNGLGNRIIHRYNGTDENLAIQEIFEVLPEINMVRENFLIWTEKN